MKYNVVFFWVMYESHNEVKRSNRAAPEITNLCPVYVQVTNGEFFLQQSSCGDSSGDEFLFHVKKEMAKNSLCYKYLQISVFRPLRLRKRRLFTDSSEA